jgi:hypothetical protein
MLTSEMCEAALAYASRGLCVLPLRGKKPMFENWPETATTDPKIVRQWWTQFPSSNIGIATGIRSRCFVVDLDPRHGGDQEWDSLRMQHPGVLDTLTDITGGGGKHIWFRYPNFTVGNYAGILPGIDIRGTGGQVVVPPSIHPETHIRYEWDGLREWYEQPIAEAPEWLLDLLRPKPNAPGKHTELLLKIPHGTQHHTLLSLAGKLRAMGLTADEMLPTLLKVNQGRCERPGPPENIKRLAESMMKYDPHNKQIFEVANRLWVMAEEAERKWKLRQAAVDAMKPVTAYELLTSTTIDTTMVIEDCLHPGCTILAGPPKAGKSYLTLGMAISISMGGKFIGAREIARPGMVAYWALEESRGRTARRLRQLVEKAETSLSNIEFMYELKPIFSGGLETIAEYCEARHPTMVVIDTLMAFVSGQQSSRRDVFREDYREIKALTDLAHKYDTAIVVVHHTNKASVGGGVGAVAGTHGVTAAADCIWTLERQPESRAVLKMVGREIEEQAFLLQLDLSVPVGWTAIEEGDDVMISGIRQLVLEVLRELGPKTPKQLSSEISKDAAYTRQLLHRMRKAGQVFIDAKGTYSLAGPISNSSKAWQDDDD